LFARRSSLTSRSSSLIFAASAVVTPGRLPASTSAPGAGSACRRLFGQRRSHSHFRVRNSIIFFNIGYFTSSVPTEEPRGKTASVAPQFPLPLAVDLHGRNPVDPSRGPRPAAQEPTRRKPESPAKSVSV